MRLNRKLEHIELSLRQKPSEGAAGFNDITLVHNSLPELNWSEIDTSCQFLNKKLTMPLLINAMTGGHPELEMINRSLAEAAAAAGVALAVGSQRAALEDSTTRSSFSVVREVNPEGVILANLGADCSLDEAQEAIAMIKADAIQLHVNAPQELAMAEGDRNFRGLLENIKALTSQLAVPVIVKEVGFGMSQESVQRLVGAGVRYMDVGGAGGTDFIAIEQARSGRRESLHWGIPTATSLLEGLHVKDEKGCLIASGGFKGALDIAKALALGAALVGMARPLLKLVVQGSKANLVSYLSALEEDLRCIMLMLGVRNIEELSRVPLVIGGATYHWLKLRGIAVEHYARR